MEWCGVDCIFWCGVLWLFIPSQLSCIERRQAMMITFNKCNAPSNLLRLLVDITRKVLLEISKLVSFEGMYRNEIHHLQLILSCF